MALVLVATAGAANANSYATAVQGDSYHEGRLFSTTWTGASTATKEAALVWATRILDRRIIWHGWPKYTTQALQHPRTGLLTNNGVAYLPDTTIAQEIIDATAEFARQLIAEDRTLDYDIEAKGITSLRAGSVALTFKDDASAKVVPDAVLDLIPAHWIISGGRSLGAIPVIR